MWRSAFSDFAAIEFEEWNSSDSPSRRWAAVLKEPPKETTVAKDVDCLLGVCDSPGPRTADSG